VRILNYHELGDGILVLGAHFNGEDIHIKIFGKKSVFQDLELF